MKKSVIKIVLFVILCLGLVNLAIADSISQEDLIKNVIAENKASRPQAVIDKYNEFKNIVATKGTYQDLSSGWAFFDDNNDKLFIGSSGAVFCGYTMNEELLLRYGYDLVGFGGIFDDELIDLLKLIGNKKYKKIVIFGAVNDLNIRVLNNCRNVDYYYCEVLDKMLDEAKKHLYDATSKVYYIKIKPMTFGRDIKDQAFIDKFNNMAMQINDNIDLFGYKSYEIPFETTLEYSEHYMHYNKAIVYETMFNAIK